MQLLKPIPFHEALQKLGVRQLVGAGLDSEAWSSVPLALRERAFFSSTVESIRFLDRAKGSLIDFLAVNRETLPTGETALKTGGRADFVRTMQDFAVKEGLGPLDPRDVGTIKDIQSQRRLELIFDTQTRQAQDYGYWQQGQDPDVLDAFPAQRFIRVQEVKEPRDTHTQYEDQVALKSDLAIWTRINEDFGVPWGPWGWGCGHDVEDVDRDEAEALGLLQPGEPAKGATKDFNDRLQASVTGLDDDMKRFLEESFGDQVEIAGDQVRWTGQTKPTKPWEPPIPPAAAGSPASGSGTPTLEQTLKAAGVEGKSQITEAEAAKLISELKEDYPLVLDQVLAGISAPLKGAMSESAVRSTAQDFLNFIPPAKAKALPKLRITVAWEAGANGSYLDGRVKLSPHLDAAGRGRVTFHELTHWLHLDGDAAFRGLIKDHFRERTKGETTVLLAPYSYRGKKDKWYEPYAGRIYHGDLKDSPEGNGLEMVTRYLELLAAPAELAKHWKNADFRETFLICLRGLF